MGSTRSIGSTRLWAAAMLTPLVHLSVNAPVSAGATAGTAQAVADETIDWKNAKRDESGSLRSLAERNGLLVGTAVDMDALAADQRSANLLDENFGPKPAYDEMQAVLRLGKQ